MINSLTYKLINYKMPKALRQLHKQRPQNMPGAVSQNVHTPNSSFSYPFGFTMFDL